MKDPKTEKRQRAWGWLDLLPPEDRKAYEERAREREELFESAERHLANSRRIGEALKRY